MIIFGWGYQTIKDYGSTYWVKCSNCNNTSWWNLKSSKTWFTLFFAPIIPYESTYMLLCHICEKGIELSGNNIKEAKKLNETTKLLINGTISEAQYKDDTFQTKLLE